MKAPEKIYVTPVGTWDTKHIPDLQDNIYIRKDALLEWASGEIKRLKQGCKEKWLDGKVPYGGVLTMQNLIDKLNKM